jgi:hypothetical protein
MFNLQITQMKQDHSEQLKSLKEVQNTHTRTKQDMSYDLLIYLLHRLIDY